MSLDDQQGKYFVDINNESHTNEKTNIEISPLATLIRLSTTNRLDDMLKSLQNDKYIFDGMALGGQITLFYAKPNTGKTLLFLKFLKDTINNSIIKSSDVFYINADDHFKGLVTKTKIADELGFNMISPFESGISTEDVIEILEKLSTSDDARGKVIILDTLKKFTDMMSKRALTELFKVLRKLTAKDATVIIAGHANKYPDSDGNIIYEGTADTLNDIDCAYSMYLLSEPIGDVKIQFRREKSRGDVVASCTYTYSRKDRISYHDMLDSVRKIDDVEQDDKDFNEHKKITLYESEMLFVQGLLLSNGKMNQSEIIKVFKNSKGEGVSSEFTESKLRKALGELAGIKWTEVRGANNAKVY